MRHLNGILVSSGLFVLASVVPALALPGPSDSPARIAVEQVSGAIEPVTPWDATSPQKLVTIEGRLFQEDAGFFYRVVDDRVSVRLADGVTDWQDLVDRAVAADPRAFGTLESLVVERANRLGIVDLILPEGTPTGWCRRLQATGLVRYAEVATYGVFTATANDPLYPQQWALNNTGQTGGTPGADVKAEAAWDITAGDPSAVVGVLDSGTLVTHPDLVLNAWHNEGEIPNNGIDDDSNGFIDDVDGWDFGNNNNQVQSSNFHGTHVTGIISAAGSNNTGIAGLAGGLGGPGTRTMAVAVGESGPISSVMDDAMLYAVDNGANVVTMSLTVSETTSFNDALDFAYNTADVFIDCAAGNNGSSVGYPARKAEVMAIASTTHNDQRSSFSNPGPELEVAAPGSNILSTQLGNSYGTSSGTSFAAPYVGALASLIRGMNASLSAPEVRQLIIDSADDIESPGFDTLTGWGRINAFEAVSQVGGFADGTIDLDANQYSCSSSLIVTVVDPDLEGDGSTGVTVRSGTEPAGEALLLDEVTAGIFRGTMEISGGIAVPDGILQAAHADTIVATYIDQDDSQGNSNVERTADASTDCLAPQILNVDESSIDDLSATISWTTDESSTSAVRYGTETPLDNEVSSATLTLFHSLALTELEECTTYRYEVQSDDALGNERIDDNNGMLHRFQTLGNYPGLGILPCRLGQAKLDLNTYGCGNTVLATVTDFDLDIDTAVADQVDVLMTSTSEPEGEWITLTETALDNGIFEGTIDLDTASPTQDGLLAVADGDLINVTYFDEDDGQGQPFVATYTSVADCEAPAISNVRVESVSSTRVEIAWETSEPATSKVEFGPDAGLGSAVEDPELRSSHRLAVSAFEACDRVLFRVSGTDQFGQLRVSDVAGSPYEFNLNQIGGLVFHDNFETDEGWDLDGEWELGAPQGQGSGSGDPAAAWSGLDVLGLDLTGTGAFPGDYEPGVTEWAKSPLINVAGESNLEVVLRRKLGLAAGDTASIGLFDNFGQSLWTSNATTDDADWIEARHAVPLVGMPSVVQIGFGISSSASGQAYGWNVDEVIVKDSTEPDYLACGGCSGAPSFAGLLAAYDADPCGASGVTLEWQPAAAWGTGAGGTYDVHRGTSPGFVPDSGNRIATGVAVTSYVDTTAPLDTEVWYVVRARNDEDCGGEGLSDGNLVRLSATETVSQSPPDSVGETVIVNPVGATHVRLDWAAAPGAASYIVRRSASPDFSSPVDLVETTGTLFEDVDVLGDGNFYAYRVFSVNACGVEAP